MISTGGGSILRPSNVEIMKRSGTLVLLTASIDKIAARIGDENDRPLAGDASSLSAIVATRLESYEAAADFTIDTDGKAVDVVAREVAACNAT